MNRVTDALELAGLLFVVAAAGLGTAQTVGLAPALLVVGLLLLLVSLAIVVLGRRGGRR